MLLHWCRDKRISCKFCLTSMHKHIRSTTVSVTDVGKLCKMQVTGWLPQLTTSIAVFAFLSNIMFTSIYNTYKVIKNEA